MATLDLLGDWHRTHYAGDLRAADADKEVVLMGWVHRRRDLGNLIFIDVRDRGGIAQIVFNKELGEAAHARAEELRAEYVVAIRGRVALRQKPNADLASGEVEIFASELRILNTAKTPPFVVEDEINASEETRLHYRYLDLRRPRPQRNLALRHRIVLEMRKTMDALGFYEIETPILTRSTPEGARDYLVPSRVHHGQFYALPQSPQIFKQILMIAGLDRYFQIARCFRDEDLRADRQPEFTQIDLEMSFPRQQDIFDVIEKVMVRACAVAGIEIKAPFRHMEYREAIRRYGIDKPDLRFGMELQDVTPHFEAARERLHFEGNVQALAAPGAASYSRKQLDELTERAKSLGARGTYTIKVTTEGAVSALDKTPLGVPGVQAIVAATGAKAGDLIVAVSAAEQIPGTDTAALIAGQLRLMLAERLNLVPKDRWEFLWLTSFPLFEWSTSEKAWAPAQHPFTGIVEEDIDKIESAPWDVRSKGYDLVANGVELGSGSIRIHSQELQARVFQMLGLDEQQRRERFGFFLDALTYGTPPHGGIALGIDRIIALLAGEKSMREVIAFPKTTAAQDLMAESPSAVEQPQEEELELMGAYPSLPSRSWTLAGHCDSLLRLLEEEIFPKAIPADDSFQRAMALILAKARDDARAAIQLAKAGYGPQSAGLCRSLVEAAINSRYIEKDPILRGSAFLASINEQNRLLSRRLEAHQMPDDIREMMAEVGRITAKSGWPWSVAERVKEIGEPLYDFAYDIVFQLLSQQLHSTVSSLAGQLKLEDPSRFLIRIGRGPEWVNEGFQTIFKYFSLTVEVSYRAFQVDNARLLELRERFAKAQLSDPLNASR